MSRPKPDPKVAECEKAKRHTPCPKGYVAWHNWAEEKSKTHMQVPCSFCGFLAIWVEKLIAGQGER